MSEAQTSASFAVGVERRFVTLETAAALTNYSSSYIERLCRDGYVPCAGGNVGQAFPALSELLSVLKVSLREGTDVQYVPALAIATPSLSSEQLSTPSPSQLGELVGNLPTEHAAGTEVTPAPLRSAPLPFSLVEDGTSPAIAAALDEVPPAPSTPLDATSPKMVEGSAPSTTPAVDTVAALDEVPPAPLPTALPEHWPVKTNVHPDEHFEEAPIFPPLIKKEDTIASPSTNVSPMLEPELAVGTPASNAITSAEPAPIARAFETEVATPAFVAPEVAELASIVVAPESAIATPTVSMSASPSVQAVEPSTPLAPATPTKEEVSTPVPLAVTNVEPSSDTAKISDAIASESEEVVRDTPPEVAEAVTEAGPEESEEITDEVTESTESSEPLDESDETAEVSDSAVAPAEEPATVELPVTAPAVEVPVRTTDEVVAQIMREAEAAKPAFSANNSASVEVRITPESAPLPVIPVPQYSIEQVTHAAHPIALPPQVVPFSTMSPAAYPQVAAVFTQPHARASEWLPWMRTSHWSRGQVRAATGSPVVEVTPNIHAEETLRAYAPAAMRPLGPTVVHVAPATTSVPVQIASAFVPPPPATSVSAPPLRPNVPVPPPVVPPMAKMTPLPSTAFNARPFVAKIAPPTPVPSSPTVVPVMTPSSVAAERAEASARAAREVEAASVQSSKTVAELRAEVADQVHDSWDAAFLAGLG